MKDMIRTGPAWLLAIAVCSLSFLGQVSAEDVLQPAANAVAAQPAANQSPAMTADQALQSIQKVENGRTLSVQYKQKKAQKILGIWDKFMKLPEGDTMKMQYYNIAVQQKDALISEVYKSCSDSRDRENEFCVIYADLVRTLGPIPDLVPGKWMQQN